MPQQPKRQKGKIMRKLPSIPQPKSKSEQRKTSGPLVTIQRRLAQNTLTEFKMGFDADEFRSKRDVQCLIHNIQDQYLHKLSLDKVSSLESIRIGWKLPPSYVLGPMLQQVIPMLLQQPAKVHHLQLMMSNAWVPLPTMKRLVSWHTLETLDLRSIRIRTRIVSEPRPMMHPHHSGSHNRGASLLRWNGGSGAGFSSLSLRGGSSSNANSPMTGSTRGEALYSLDDDDDEDDNDHHLLHGSLEDNITADDRILVVLPYLSPSIKTLKLVNCDLQVEDMMDLIQILRKKRHLRILSLRHNRRLFMDGVWESFLLQELSFLQGLDLSICDLDPVDGMRFARALKQNQGEGQLRALGMAGNYRLAEAVPDLVEACATTGIMEFDCSFCDVPNRSQKQVFDHLATIKPCSLRSLTMQAIRIKNADSLIKCIELNTSLERLILNHPREPFELPSHAMDALLEAVRENYYLHVFKFDPPYRLDPQVLEEMDHWMTLNKCGRSILVHDPRKNWPIVLANVAKLDNHDMFYWILRNGAELF